MLTSLTEHSNGLHIQCVYTVFIYIYRHACWTEISRLSSQHPRVSRRSAGPSAAVAASVPAWTKEKLCTFGILMQCVAGISALTWLLWGTPKPFFLHYPIPSPRQYSYTWGTGSKALHLMDFFPAFVSQIHWGYPTNSFTALPVKQVASYVVRKPPLTWQLRCCTGLSAARE